MSKAEVNVSENSATTTSGEAFSEGDLVVYPNHGAGCVSGVEEKTILGEERSYYVVYIPDAELTLSIPADGDSGLRACADEDTVEAALSVLRGEATEMPQNWNQRLKHNQAKLRDGEISQVAEVVRNLSSYGGEHNLSTGERNMLMKARRILVSEVALVRDLDARRAEELVDEVLSEGITEDAT
jgi:CarD family transcriptional regulator